MYRDISDDELGEIIDDEIIKNESCRKLMAIQKSELKKEIFDSIRGLDILENMLQDKEISEIMINGTDSIFIERRGFIEKYEGKFSSKERLNDIIQQIVSKMNRRVNEASPIVDSRLKDGSRVNIVLDPIAINGPVVTIRKFPEERVTMNKLISIGSISKEVADFLKILVISKYNIFLSGGTSSGKTTFLNALSNYIPKDERVITIEDSAELQLQNISNLVRLEARQANEEGENEISIRDLIRSSLRMRPDRIIVGEVRGAEAFDMLQAMNTGHDGSLSTGHANSPEDMLSRLQMMVLMGANIPISAIKSQIAAGVDVIVHLGRIRDKSRKVLEITEVIGVEEDKIITNTLFKFQEENNNVNEIVEGELIIINPMKNVDKLISAGFMEEANIYGKRNKV